MLAQQRRGAEEFGRSVGQTDRTADQIARAHFRVSNFFGNPHMLDLRILEDFVDRVDWRVGNAVGVQARQPVGAGFLLKLLPQNSYDLLMTIGSMFTRREARV